MKETKVLKWTNKTLKFGMTETKTYQLELDQDLKWIILRETFQAYPTDTPEKTLMVFRRQLP